MHTDALEAKIVAGNWQPPEPGDTVDLLNGESRPWRAVTADKDGWFGGEGFRSGYAYVPVLVDSDCIMLLQAVGHSLLYVNGEPRGGDPYSAGYMHLPVSLHKGTNDLLFVSGRGGFKVTLTPPRIR